MSDYPVYISPDGQHEQVAATPARRVQLKHAGWRPKSTIPAPAPDEQPTVLETPKQKQARPDRTEPQ